MGDPLSTPPSQPPGPPPTTSNEQPPEPGQPAAPPPSRPPADGPPPLKTYKRRRRKPMGPPPATQKEGQLSGDENILPVKKRLFSGDGCGVVGPLPKHQPTVIRFRCGSSSQSTSTPPAFDPQLHPPSPSAQMSPRHQEVGPPSPHAILLLLQLQSRRTYLRPKPAGTPIPPGEPMGPPRPRTDPLDRPSQHPVSYASLPLKKRDIPGGDDDNDEPPPPEAFAWP